ncbi:MAG: hypothetical protein QXK12_00950 [Candidatus Nezhaarchaeales archaeon]
MTLNKAYKCPLCGLVIRTGPYDWMLELEDQGQIVCPRCRKAVMREVEASEGA